MCRSRLLVDRIEGNPPELLSDDESVEINEVLLPGVGLRYEFTNHEGDRIGVIARRTGEFEIVIYGKGDPDASRLVVRLNSQEAETSRKGGGVRQIPPRAHIPQTSGSTGTAAGATGGRFPVQPSRRPHVPRCTESFRVTAVKTVWHARIARPRRGIETYACTCGRALE